jgi:hypothetical protein
MSKWILMVIYDINIWLLITTPLRQVYPDSSGSDNLGRQSRAGLRNDEPLHCQINNLNLHKVRPA